MGAHKAPREKREAMGLVGRTPAPKTDPAARKVTNWMQRHPAHRRGTFTGTPGDAAELMRQQQRDQDREAQLSEEIAARITKVDAERGT